MSIERIQAAGLGALAEPRPRQAKPAAAAPPSADVKVSLGRSVPQASAQVAEINASRVSEIKQAIAEGKFQINPDAIADRLLDTARELIRSNRPQ